MKKYWKYYLVARFDNFDSTGMGKWILAALILNAITMSMSMSSSNDTIIMDISIFPIGICIGAFFFIENSLKNRQLFSNTLPLSSKEEVNMGIGLFVGVFLCLGCFVAIVTILFGEISLVECKNALREDSAQYLFTFFYYVSMSAIVLPMGMIEDKKKWYLAFTGAAVLLELFSLGCINLLPQNKGSVQLGGMFREHITSIPGYHMLLAGMGVVSILLVIGSYRLLQKLNAPKRY